MCPPDPADRSPGGAAGLRERLRRLSAAGGRAGVYRPPTPQGTAGGADGIEIIRARFALTHQHGHSALGECLETLAAHGEGGDPAQMVWLDTETTGLAGGTGTYVFLVGVASLEGATITIEQFLLRRLSAESYFLTVLQERLARAQHLVTFNGQRFDWPILEARFILTRLRPVPIAIHTDLIHPARRLWHRVLGTHRLSALEAAVLGAPRSGDIQGWEIPTVYVQYLRTSERGALEPILAHNRTDLLALISLQAAVARILRDPARTPGPIDWEGAGVLLARRGDHQQAAACLERALAEPLGARDRWRVLRRCVGQYRILGFDRRIRERWEEAALVTTLSNRYKAQVFLEVARVREKAGDLAGARSAAGEALRAALAPQDQEGSCPPPVVDRIKRRLVRLIPSWAG